MQKTPELCRKLLPATVLAAVTSPCAVRMESLARRMSGARAIAPHPTSTSRGPANALLVRVAVAPANPAGTS